MGIAVDEKKVIHVSLPVGYTAGKISSWQLLFIDMFENVFLENEAKDLFSIFTPHTLQHLLVWENHKGA